MISRNSQNEDDGGLLEATLAHPVSQFMLEITSNPLVTSSQLRCDTTRLDVNALFPAKDRDVTHSEKLLVVCVAFGEIWCAAPLCALSIQKRWRRSGPSCRRLVRGVRNGRSGWRVSRPCWERQPWRLGRRHRSNR